MMKKYGILTVSMIAIMTVTSTRADIASTTYVDSKIQPVAQDLANHVADTAMHVTTAEKNTWNAKVATAQGASNADKVMITDDSGDVTTTTFLHEGEYNANNREYNDTYIPSAAAVEDIALTVAGGAYVPLDQGDGTGGTNDNKNKAMITDNTGTVVPGQIATGMIANNAVTNDKLSEGINTSLGLANSAVQPTAIVDMETKEHASETYATQSALGTTNTNVSNLTTRVGNAETAINTLNGDVSTNGSVAKSIADALAEAKVSTAIQGVQRNGVDLTADANGKVNVLVPTGALASLNEVAESNLAGALANKINAKADASDLDSYELKANVTSKGSATNPVYFDENGVATPITSYAGKAATAGVADSANAVAWSGVQNKPTTLAGYGITDAQGTLTFDDTPTENSNNPVKSGGLYTALGAKANKNDLGTAASADVSTNGVAANEDGLVTGGQVQTAISNLKLGTTYQAKSDSTVENNGNYIVAGSDVKGNLVELDTQLKKTDTTATNAAATANAAIPKPSGTCTDCVLHYAGATDKFTWEEIGR